MSSFIFRQLAAGGNGEDKAERLFRAAVSAFCSLPRPSRHDVAQLDDLARPLFDRVSAAGRRFAAAALSECGTAPPDLVARLCAEGVDVAAPLLVRSPAVSDAELIALIGRFGLPYARAIARRPDLNPVIRSLVTALTRYGGPEGGEPASAAPVATLPPAAEDVARPSAAVDEAHRRLRAMMRPSGSGTALGKRLHYKRVRDAALSGHQPFLHTALADALGIPLDVAARVVEADGGAALAVALRALDVEEEQAFLVAVLARPDELAAPHAARLFLDGYAALSAEDVELALLRWRQQRPEAAARLRAS